MFEPHLADHCQFYKDKRACLIKHLTIIRQGQSGCLSCGFATQRTPFHRHLKILTLTMLTRILNSTAKMLISRLLH